MADDNVVRIMDVSELLAQKRQLLEERSAAPDEVEFTLTEREFDSRLRRAFAERERNVEKQVRKLFVEHMHEVESRIADAKAELATMIATAKAELPYALSAADVARMIDNPVRADAYGKMISDERKRWRAEVQKLRDEHDLRISALLQATEKLERGLGGDRAADVIDLPMVPLRGARRA